MKAWKEALRWLVCAALFFTLSIHYFRPASFTLFSKNSPAVLLSDGSDATTVPFQHHTLRKTADEHPSWLLYGSILTPQLNAPSGFGLWIPWIERGLVLALRPWVEPEKSGVALILAIAVLNGLSFLLFARVMRWPWVISVTLATAYALTPYVRARAGVHPILAGTFGFPLALAALEISARRFETSIQRLKAQASAAMLLVLACTAAHYYQILLIGIAPFLLPVYLHRRAIHHGDASTFSWKNLLAGLKVLLPASIPAILFLGWNRFVPFPPEAPALPQAHFPIPWFFKVYVAHFVDYLSGDIVFGSDDLMPWRGDLTAWVRWNLEGSNFHERTNGIRWSLLVLFAVASVSSIRSALRTKKGFWNPDAKNGSIAALWLVFWSLWFSLDPHFPFTFFKTATGPAAWLHFFIPQFRVASRFGVLVYLGVLWACGDWLTRRFGNTLSKLPAHRAGIWAFIGVSLMCLDYPALNPSWTETVAPSWSELLPEKRACGRGLAFPYFSEMNLGPGFRFYREIQALHGTDCELMGRVAPDSFNAQLSQLFGPETFASAIQSGEGATRVLETRLSQFLTCTRARWIRFHDEVPAAFRESLCKKLGWEYRTTACRSPEPNDGLILSSGEYQSCFPSL